MLVFGLTGPSGSGKGEVAEIFASFGIPVLDADRIYHQLLLPPSPCLGELVRHFGNHILTPDGTLNRRALAEIVFSDPEELAALNRISHTYVMQSVRRKLELLQNEGVSAAVFDAPQLFEAGAEKECNIVVSVLSDRNTRVRRICKRDGISPEEAERRADVQKSDAFFRANSDYVIENNGTPEELLPKVRQILSETGVLQP